MFHEVKNPPKWMLDGLLSETRAETCPGCGVKEGKPHKANCDWAMCLSTGTQRYSCNCGNCGKDCWEGVLPGFKVAHQEKLVCYDTATGKVMLDLNEAMVLIQNRKAQN